MQEAPLKPTGLALNQIPASSSSPSISSRSKTSSSFLERRKLALVLDLDNTLVHTKSQESLGCNINLSDFRDDGGNPELFKLTLAKTFFSPSSWSCSSVSREGRAPGSDSIFYIKLRPFVRYFLRALAPFYELSLYTNGIREYTDALISILDPERDLFEERVVCRNSEQEITSKTVERLYPVLDDRCYLIFDDRKNVWPFLKPRNLILAEYYAWLNEYDTKLREMYGTPAVDYSTVSSSNSMKGKDSSSRSLFNEKNQLSSSSSSSRLGRESSGRRLHDYDKHLFFMVDILIRAHHAFFEDPLKADLGLILTGMRGGILKGLSLSFKGFSTEEEDFDDLERLPVCKRAGELVYVSTLAKELGAVVASSSGAAARSKLSLVFTTQEDGIDDSTVLSRPTRKPLKVHLLWLLHCSATWKKAPFDAYDASVLCGMYGNKIPLHPFRMHWIHGVTLTHDMEGGWLLPSSSSSSSSSAPASSTSYYLIRMGQRGNTKKRLIGAALAHSLNSSSNYLKSTATTTPLTHTLPPAQTAWGLQETPPKEEHDGVHTLDSLVQGGCSLDWGVGLAKRKILAETAPNKPPPRLTVLGGFLPSKVYPPEKEGMWLSSEGADDRGGRELNVNSVLPGGNKRIYPEPQLHTDGIASTPLGDGMRLESPLGTMIFQWKESLG